ncbi:MAG: Crp/Fnr family transcriptional regulator [Pseudomonadota bacterium]
MPSTDADIAGIPGLDDVARAILRERSRPVAAPAGMVLFQAGEPCEELVLLSRGSVRVRIVSEQGREIQLYRVAPGDTCVMSIACLMGEDVFQAEGIAESDIAGRAIRRQAFRDLLGASPAFRDTVLAVQTRRIHDLVGLVDALAFRHAEARLAACLVERASRHQIVEETHQQLALDIGTVREVVSRRLKGFEREGLVRLERGRIQVLDLARLKGLAHGTA